MASRIRASAACALAVGGFAIAPHLHGAASQSNQQTFREHVDVARVLIDARVVDDSGQPITGLTAAQFSVRIAGKPAHVDTVDWVSAGVPRDEPLSATGAGTPLMPRGRWIVFLFQRAHDLSDATGLMRVRDDLAAFADVVTRDDHVAILSFDSTLHYWLDFTNDVEGIRRVLRHDILVQSPPPIVVSAPPSLAGRLTAETAQSTYTIEKSLQLLGEALDPLPGAKSIVMLGHGMGTWVPRFGIVQLGSDYSEAFAALQKARVSVFCIDITKADYHPRQEGLQQIAQDTGGYYMQSHIFTRSIFERLGGALAGYYTLSIVAPQGAKGEQQIDIKLIGRKGNVVSKRAYLAEP